MGELQQLRNKNNSLSDELWLVANNPNNFANGSKSVKRNLGLCKCSEIYLM